jgi:spore coat protein U-like protein
VAFYTGNFAVTMTVQATCTISTSSMTFGNYTGTTVLGNGTLTITCTNTTPYNITANAGLHWQGGSWYDAYMTGPAGALMKYNFYQDSAHTKVWGGTVGYDSEAGTGNSLPQIYTAYGVLLGGSYKIPGAYTDTLTFIINY